MFVSKVAHCPNCKKEAVKHAQFWRCESDGECNGLEFYIAGNGVEITTGTLHLFLKASSPKVCRAGR